MSEGKVSPGQDFNPPPAAIWNNMVDAGRAWADDRFSNPANAPTRPRETDILKLKNMSGALRRKGEILRIDGKALEEVTDENTWLIGVEPTTDGYFGILKRPCDNAAVENVQVSGACIALVNIIDAQHTKAAAVAGEYVLESADSGPLEILYMPGETGEQECVVRFAGGSVGGGEFMWFTIVEVHCPDDYDPDEYLIVTPLWVQGSCGKTPPGAEDDGTYKFYELCGDGFDGQVVDELPGTIGNGHHLYPFDSYSDCQPKWIINLLCHLPEC